jgi:hypothetical protein
MKSSSLVSWVLNEWVRESALSPTWGTYAAGKWRAEWSGAKIGGFLDYSRRGVCMSLPLVERMRNGRVLSARFLSAAMLALGMLATDVSAQYPGRVAKTDKSAPVLRSVAVLEWTGEAGKPSASRLVPVVVYDGEQLNDGTIYLTRPEPLALAGGTEYELQTAGKPSGIFDVFGSGEIRGSWLGFGAWKPLTPVAAAKAANSFNTSSLYNSEEDDKPVLKRKHPKGTDTDDGGKTSASGSDSASGSSSTGDASQKKTADAPTDPDRPTLKRKTADDSGTTTASTGASGSKPAEVDPDRPTIRRKRNVPDAGTMETSSAAPDPDRPRLKRGKPADLANTEDPRLLGEPPAMQQAVAVSDASTHTEHPWKYSWANPEDETKMKVALEAMARTALGLDTPPAPAKPARKTTASRPATKKVSMIPAEPPALAEFADEQFRVFELTYGATATLVLTASTPKPPAVDTPEAATDKPPVIKRGKPATTTNKQDAPTQLPPKPAPQKYVTLVAQPDLYGGILVLYKSVTDSAHLDETPRMRLVDAVDVMGDNRGELLFELRGQTQRQFALFRVLRGSAEQLFATVALP